MIWKINRLIQLLAIGLLFEGCLFYSFSGTSLSEEVKSFSIQSFQNRTALGPTDLSNQLDEKLGNELLQKTALKQVNTNGDIQFEGTITSFQYSPMAPTVTAQGDTASRTKLTISVEVTYINKKDKEFEFNKKSFSQSADMDATANVISEEPRLVEEVLKKLVEDIFSASVANW